MRGSTVLEGVQVYVYFDDVISSLLSGNEVGAIYLDYAKAFDKVNHRLLLMKLCHYGFPDKTVEWIESFLSNRYKKLSLMAGFPFLLSYSVAFLRVQF